MTELISIIFGTCLGCILAVGILSFRIRDLKKYKDQMIAEYPNMHEKYERTMETNDVLRGSLAILEGEMRIYQEFIEGKKQGLEFQDFFKSKLEKRTKAILWKFRNR